MSKIKMLPQHIIAKIAAGEVIERPASVVKELVENALDAGGKNIKIEVEKAGFKKISVLDDGHGMTKEDLKICALPHTTSKIVCEDDLCRILSFGFRGEAISTIAAVSELTIKSRPATEAIGHLVSLVERKIIKDEAVGMPIGTQVIVQSLFENTPARKKFFSNPSNEFFHIVSLITRLALNQPEVGFSLWHNNKNILQLPANESSQERLRVLLGEKTFASLLPLSENDEHISIQGFIATPQLCTRSKAKQFLFVNNRSIKSLPISLAIKDAYGNLLDPRSHPVFYLSLNLPPESLDVNIHPRKEEVKLQNQTSVNEILQKAVEKVLENNSLIFRYNEEPPFEDWKMEAHTADLLRENTKVWNVKEITTEEEILQLHNTYLIKETPNGALIIDQHAAHERILYEQFLETYQKQKEIHVLAEPITINLSPTEAAYLSEHLDIFNNIGFEIEHFGGSTFKLNALPKIFQKRDLALLISEVLEEMMQEKNNLSIDRYTERTIAYLACRSAIKAGDYLTQDERQRLIKKLFETKSLYTCPHGRPVQIEITSDDLQRLFRRK